MFNPDMFWAADWDGLYAFFARGHPPLMLQLLAINTIFMVLFIIRKATRPHAMRHTTSLIVQGMLIFANAAIAFQDYALPVLRGVL